jgi:recombination protein RecA
MYGKGISKEGCVLDMAADIGVVTKSGSWYSYNDQRIGQGRENGKQFFEENPDLMEEVEDKVREHYGLKKLKDEGTEKDGE